MGRAGVVWLAVASVASVALIEQGTDRAFGLLRAAASPPLETGRDRQRGRRRRGENEPSG